MKNRNFIMTVILAYSISMLFFSAIAAADDVELINIAKTYLENRSDDKGIIYIYMSTEDRNKFFDLHFRKERGITIWFSEIIVSIDKSTRKVTRVNALRSPN